MQLDADLLCRVVARAQGAARLTWLGPLAAASDAAFDALLAALAPTSLPTRSSPSLELALARLQRDAPDRFEAVVARLGAGWQPVAGRATILLAQLAEARRGPLHPELERIRQVLEDPTPW